MRWLRETWRLEARERPAAARLALIGIGMLSLGGGLAGAGQVLLAQLIAGLALLPLFPDDLPAPSVGASVDRPQDEFISVDRAPAG